MICREIPVLLVLGPTTHNVFISQRNNTLFTTFYYVLSSLADKVTLI